MSFWRSIREREYSKGPFQGNGLISFSGSIVGTLSPNSVNEKLQGHEQILIVVPHFHHIVPLLDDYLKGLVYQGLQCQAVSKAGSRFKAPVPLLARFLVPSD